MNDQKKKLLNVILSVTSILFLLQLLWIAIPQLLNDIKDMHKVEEMGYHYNVYFYWSLSVIALLILSFGVSLLVVDKMFKKTILNDQWLTGLLCSLTSVSYFVHPNVDMFSVILMFIYLITAILLVKSIAAIGFKLKMILAIPICFGNMLFAYFLSKYLFVFGLQGFLLPLKDWRVWAMGAIPTIVLITVFIFSCFEFYKIKTGKQRIFNLPTFPKRASESLTKTVIMLTITLYSILIIKIGFHDMYVVLNPGLMAIVFGVAFLVVDLLYKGSRLNGYWLTGVCCLATYYILLFSANNSSFGGNIEFSICCISILFLCRSLAMIFIKSNLKNAKPIIIFGGIMTVIQTFLFFDALLHIANEGGHGGLFLFLISFAMAAIVMFITSVEHAIIKTR